MLESERLGITGDLPLSKFSTERVYLKRNNLKSNGRSFMITYPKINEDVLLGYMKRYDSKQTKISLGINTLGFQLIGTKSFRQYSTKSISEHDLSTSDGVFNFSLENDLMYLEDIKIVSTVQLNPRVIIQIYPSNFPRMRSTNE